MKTLLTLAGLTLLALQCARAEEPSSIELKNKSAFTMDASGRNPFWPIGWKPVARTQTNTEHVGPEILPSAFLVSSITVDNGTRFAIINGKPMQEGQQFGLQLGNQTYQLTVKKIEDGQVILARRDQEMRAREVALQIKRTARAGADSTSCRNTTTVCCAGSWTRPPPAATPRRTRSATTTRRAWTRVPSTRKAPGRSIPC